MVSKVFKVFAWIFWVLAGLMWVVLGLTAPGGVSNSGQPLDPALYYEVGAFVYWILGTAYLVPVGIVAGIGYFFSWIGGKFESSNK